jgi:transcriptional regulator with XRE-family HTH domain
MGYKSKQYHRSRLTAEQLKAANLIVENEFRLLTEDGSKLTQGEIASRVGVTRQTVWKYRQNSNFNAYMAEVADEHLASHRAEVYDALLTMALGKKGNGLPSVKALDLYLRRFGLLTDRTVIENEDKEQAMKRKTDAEIADEIEKLSRMIEG